MLPRMYLHERIAPAGHPGDAAGPAACLWAVIWNTLIKTLCCVPWLGRQDLD